MAGVSQRSRLKSRYEQEIRPSLVERFGYSTPMQAPAISKITLNMGVGDAKQDSKVLEAATEQLATIAGQRPSVRRARKSIAAFKLREGMPVGVSVTLRGERSYEFLDRLMSVAIPRIRDFRGMNPQSFDGRGNYSLGVREQIIFPEIDYDSIDQTRGLDITITTSAKTDLEAFALLEAFGFPFARPEAAAPAPAAPARPAAADTAAETEVETAVDGEDAVEADAAVADAAVAEEPVAAEPVAEQPVAAEPVAEQPVAEELVAEEPQGEEPQVDEPAAEDAAAEEPAAAAEEPAAEVSVESVTETVSDADPTAESPASENAAERSAEEPDPDAQAAEPAPDAPNDQE